VKNLINIQKGKDILSNSKLIICSIVRDCAENLSINIPVINTICNYSKDYMVIIYENDSKDNTKDILREWAITKKNIFINIKDFNLPKSIPKQNEITNINPYYSLKRIEKMAYYRNQYLEYISKNNIDGDFIIIVDLDVAKIEIEGILDSFGQSTKWDMIAANGYSLSPRFTKRYHDTYALIEDGNQNAIQTEEVIKANQYKFSGLSTGMPLVKVFSAFGGLAIYRFETIVGSFYEVHRNNDIRVEVKCEHVGLNSQIQKKGYHNFYINPNMRVKYQTLSFQIISNSIKRFINNWFY
jgi:hypothetical protein